jgi:WD40 repeat protein
MARMTPQPAGSPPPSESRTPTPDETIEDTDAFRDQVLDVSAPRSPTPAGSGGAPHMVPVEALRTGRILAGRYQIIQRLGVGGMGEVFKATDAELDSLVVAIKVLPPILATNARSVNRLRTEAAISLKLTHPNICRLQTFRVDGDVKFLVMEYIEGQTLEELLDVTPERRMAPDRLLPIARDVAQALDFAHGLRPPILHRDIKPSNVMVTPGKQGKVLDFGIARELKDSMTRMTGKDTSGTLLYMSPEQFTGSTPTAASDIYSFAAMLYECISGHAPFWQGSIAHQLLNQQPGPIPGVGEEINRALQCGLAKNGAERPPSAKALLDMMEGKAPPKPVSARPAEFTVASRPAKARPEKSHRHGVLAWFFVLLIALSAVGVLGVKQRWWPQSVLEWFGADVKIADVIAEQDEAERLWEKVKDVDPGQKVGLSLKEVEVLLRTANDQTTKKDYGDAINTFRTIQERCNDISVLDGARANTRELVNVAATARAEADAVAARDDATDLWNNAVAAVDRAGEQFESGEFGEADVNLRSAVSLFGQAAAQARTAKEIESARGSYEQKWASVDEAILGQYGGAVWEEAQKALRAAKQGGVRSATLTKWGEAAALLDRAWELAVREKQACDAVSGHLKEATKRFAERDYAAALKQVDSALAIQPECREANVLKARIVSSRSSVRVEELFESDPAGALEWADQAIPDLRSLLSLVPDDPDGMAMLTRIQELRSHLEGLFRRGRKLTGHSEWVSAIAFRAGTKELVTGSWDRTLIVWDTATGEKLRTIQATGNVVSVAYSHDGSLLAWAEGPRAVIIPAAGGEPKVLKGHLLSVTALAFSPDGKRLVTCGSDDSARIWDVATGDCLRTLDHGADANCGCFSPDGTLIATGAADGNVRIWDVEEGRPPVVLDGGEVGVLAVGFSPDGKLVASGDGSGAIRIWDSSSHALKTSLDGHRGSVSCLAFSPQSGRLASSGGDKIIRLWEVSSGRCVQELKEHSDWVRSVQFSPEGGQLASGGDDKALIIWEKGLRAPSVEVAPADSK